jgi:hypothetical protein
MCLVGSRLTVGSCWNPGGFLVNGLAGPAHLPDFRRPGGPCVTDYGTGKMINPDPAFFVPIVLDAVTGETDYRAYYLKVEADQAPSYFTPCQ